jgi:thiol-disulfide isomerase/thioredoxin
MTIPLQTPKPPQQKPSPVLLVFLILPIVMLVAAVVMILNSAAPSASMPPTPQAVTLPPMPTPISLADTPIIDFELATLAGQTVRFSDFQGRIVFLNFWQTTCEPCKRELPTFEAFVAAQPPDGAVVLAVNVAENPDVVSTFLQDRGVSNLSVLMDIDAAVADSYGVFQLPVTFGIDRNGIVRFPKYGEMTREEMDAYTEALSQEIT